MFLYVSLFSYVVTISPLTFIQLSARVWDLNLTDNQSPTILNKTQIKMTRKYFYTPNQNNRSLCNQNFK